MVMVCFMPYGEFDYAAIMKKMRPPDRNLPLMWVGAAEKV